MKQFTLEQLLNSAKSAGYPVFEGGNYNLNTFAIRSELNCKSGQKVPNAFNDLFCVVYKKMGVWEMKQWRCTTIPGDDYFEKPYNEQFGTAIIVPKFYKGAYKLGVHFGKPALQQVGVLSLYRDRDKDLEIDLDPATIQNTSQSACNVHYSNKAARLNNKVENWSAGCIVLCYGHEEPEYKAFISLYEAAISIGKWENSFSLGLMTENQIITI